MSCLLKREEMVFIRGHAISQKNRIKKISIAMPSEAGLISLQFLWHASFNGAMQPILAATVHMVGQLHMVSEHLFMDAGMYGKAGHPVFSNATIAQTSEDMKHLEFVRAYGQYYATKVACAYNSSCSVLPASCRTGLRSIETKVTTLSAPIITGLQQSSERVLWSLDSKVGHVNSFIGSILYTSIWPAEI